MHIVHHQKQQPYDILHELFMVCSMKIFHMAKFETRQTTTILSICTLCNCVLAVDLHAKPTKIKNHDFLLYFFFAQQMEELWAAPFFIMHCFYINNGLNRKAKQIKALVVHCSCLCINMKIFIFCSRDFCAWNMTKHTYVHRLTLRTAAMKFNVFDEHFR